jgi:hypothetical protein
MPKPKEETFNVDEVSRLKEAIPKIEHPDQFAKLFCDAAATQTVIRDTLSTQIIKLLQTDIEGRKAIKGLISDVEKEESFILKGRIWSFVKYLLTSIGTLILTLVAQYFSQKR